MSFTQTDLDNINAAIAAGEMTVETQGRRVTYRSIDELLKARATIQADMATGASASTSPRRGTFAVRFTTARGD